MTDTDNTAAIKPNFFAHPMAIVDTDELASTPASGRSHILCRTLV